MMAISLPVEMPKNSGVSSVAVAEDPAMISGASFTAATATCLETSLL